MLALVKRILALPGKRNCTAASESARGAFCSSSRGRWRLFSGTEALSAGELAQRGARKTRQVHCLQEAPSTAPLNPIQEVREKARPKVNGGSFLYSWTSEVRILSKGTLNNWVDYTDCREYFIHHYLFSYTVPALQMVFFLPLIGFSDRCQCSSGTWCSGSK